MPQPMKEKQKILTVCAKYALPKFVLILMYVLTFHIQIQWRRTLLFHRRHYKWHRLYLSKPCAVETWQHELSYWGNGVRCPLLTYKIHFGCEPVSLLPGGEDLLLCPSSAWRKISQSGENGIKYYCRGYTEGLELKMLDVKLKIKV